MQNHAPYGFGLVSFRSANWLRDVEVRFASSMITYGSVGTKDAIRQCFCFVRSGNGGTKAAAKWSPITLRQRQERIAVHGLRFCSPIISTARHLIQERNHPIGLATARGVDALEPRIADELELRCHAADQFVSPIARAKD